MRAVYYVGENVYVWLGEKIRFLADLADLPGGDTVNWEINPENWISFSSKNL
jgi:hypothetical protein